MTRNYYVSEFALSADLAQKPPGTLIWYVSHTLFCKELLKSSIFELKIVMYTKRKLIVFISAKIMCNIVVALRKPQNAPHAHTFKVGSAHTLHLRNLQSHITSHAFSETNNSPIIHTFLSPVVLSPAWYKPK